MNQPEFDESVLGMDIRSQDVHKTGARNLFCFQRGDCLFCWFEMKEWFVIVNRF